MCRIIQRKSGLRERSLSQNTIKQNLRNCKKTCISYRGGVSVQWTKLFRMQVVIDKSLKNLLELIIRFLVAFG